MPAAGFSCTLYLFFAGLYLLFQPEHLFDNFNGIYLFFCFYNGFIGFIIDA